MKNTYLFQSARLGFRNWLPTDVKAMAAISADEEVMEFFASVASENQTLSFITRMQQLFEDKGFCYFAVEMLETGEFIGFIGLSEPTYEAAFTPCVDIGWRLKKTVWNKGLATEGAIRCLEYAFDTLKLEKIYATAPKINEKSQRVMQKIGMKKAGEFEHPLLLDDARLKTCVLYEKTQEDHNRQAFAEAT